MILVTGGSGLVGTWLICKLLLQGKEVRAIKRVQTDFSDFELVSKLNSITPEHLQKLQWVLGDINDIISLENAMRGCDYIYHCAALVSFKQKDRDLMMEVNVEGTANVVNTALALRVKKLIYASSVAALGRSQSGVEAIDEDTKWETSGNNSNYAISKYKAEMEVWRGIEEDLPAAMVNPGIINGPGTWQRSNGRMYYNIYKGLPFYTKGGGGYVDVRDVVNAMIQLMESDIVAQRYVMVGENLSILDCFNMIADNLKKKRPHIYIGPFLSEIGWRIFGVYSYLTGKEPIVTKELARTALLESKYSSDKIKRELGFKFIPMTESIKYCSEVFLAEQKNI
ncbi:MAG: NAD-dependent epimerase/dehydratase family protein [Bacteroidota bacterium]|nr:NAD-dependent epimerase/dehydratase family protein [Bacteroidota bacterium]